MSGRERINTAVSNLPNDLTYPDFQFIKEVARNNVRCFVRWCGENLKFEDPILDVACGYRDNRPEIDPKYQRKFLSTDLNFALKPDFVADALRLPIADESIGCALCTEMLEHIPSPALLMDEIARILKPRGLLVVTVPFWLPIHEKEHWQQDFWRFTPRGLYWILKQDFCDIRIKRADHGLFPVSILAHARRK